MSDALQIIRSALSLGPLGVSYSGGKDSTVLLHLVRRLAPEVPAAFFDSGCEYRWTYDMIAEVGAETIKPGRDLLEMCRYGGYWGYQNPVDDVTEIDFTEVLVYEPSRRFVAAHGLSVLAIGLRAEESGGRRMSAWKRGPLYQTRSGIWHCCPLAFWRTEDIWAYLAANRLPYNFAYDRMDALGIPRPAWRISCLLGATGIDTEGRYAYLRQIDPPTWAALAAEFPKIRGYT